MSPPEPHIPTLILPCVNVSRKAFVCTAFRAFLHAHQLKVIIFRAEIIVQDLFLTKHRFSPIHEALVHEDWVTYVTGLIA